MQFEKDAQAFNSAWKSLHFPSSKLQLQGRNWKMYLGQGLALGLGVANAEKFMDMSAAGYNRT